MNCMNRHPKYESGAAMVVALLMLLVMTILGVSTMSTATMEMRMAANDRFSENAFQLAETGLDTDRAELSQGTLQPPPAGVANTCSTQQAAVTVADLGGTYQTQICFIGDLPDLSAQSSLGKIRTYHFQNNSQGVANGQATSLHRMGMSAQGPGGP
ncbi:MAG: pilus assembly PilX family protein [Gammaproteobacteria bacterium]